MDACRALWLGSAVKSVLTLARAHTRPRPHPHRHARVEKDVTVCYLGFSIQVLWGARLGSEFAGTMLVSLPSQVRKTLKQQERSKWVSQEKINCPRSTHKCPPWPVLMKGRALLIPTSDTGAFDTKCTRPLGVLHPSDSPGPTPLAVLGGSEFSFPTSS